MGFWPRWQPELQAAKRIVDDGALGELYYAQMAGGPSPIDPHEVLLSQVIMDGMFRSAEAGREVEVQMPEL